MFWKIKKDFYHQGEKKSSIVKIKGEGEEDNRIAAEPSCYLRPEAQKLSLRPCPTVIIMEFQILFMWHCIILPSFCFSIFLYHFNALIIIHWFVITLLVCYYSLLLLCGTPWVWTRGFMPSRCLFWASPPVLCVTLVQLSTALRARRWGWLVPPFHELDSQNWSDYAEGGSVSCLCPQTAHLVCWTSAPVGFPLARSEVWDLF